MINKLNGYMYSAIKIIGIISLIWILFTISVTPTLSSITSEWRNNSMLKEVITQNILALVFSIAAIAVILLINKKITVKKEIALIIIIFGSIVYFFALIYQYNFLNISTPIDDTAIVIDAAKEFIKTGNVSGWYMSANPQNLLIMFIYAFIFIITNSYNIFNIYVFFSFLHVASALLIYFVTAMKKNYFISLIVTMLFMATIQINLHVLFMYTDTLSYFSLLLTFLFLAKYSNEFGFKRLLYLILASVFASITFLTKGLYLILIIAIIITIILLSPRYQKFFAVIPIAIFVISMFTWNSFISNTKILPIEDYGMPNTHYIFMGMNTDNYLRDTTREYKLAGGYDDNDLMFSKQLFWDEKVEKSEISRIHISKVIERLDGITYVELLEFFNAKESSTWSSGDLKSTMSLKLATNQSLLSQRLANSKKLNFYMQTIQGIYYIIFILYFVKSYKTKRDNELYFISGLFMIGVFLFIFIWESSPRYAMIVMPISLLLLPYISSDNKEIQLNIKQ